jgi:hypothetical protein
MQYFFEYGLVPGTYWLGCPVLTASFAGMLFITSPFSLVRCASAAALAGINWLAIRYWAYAAKRLITHSAPAPGRTASTGRPRNTLTLSVSFRQMINHPIVRLAGTKKRNHLVVGLVRGSSYTEL